MDRPVTHAMLPTEPKPLETKPVEPTPVVPKPHDVKDAELEAQGQTAGHWAMAGRTPVKGARAEFGAIGVTDWRHGQRKRRSLAVDDANLGNSEAQARPCRR